MLEAKYFKDYKHNYMILKCDEANAGESYRYSMLACNKIDGIVKCSVRNVNSETYLYYDISSKVTLETLYQGKKMSYEQVRDFFSQMDMIYRNLGQFFMEESGLLLRQDCIFYDFTSKKFFGLYYPAADTSGDNRYEPLMDFLLNHTDTGNQKLADIIYQVYEMAESKFFSITDALALFDEPQDVSAVPMAVDTKTFVENNFAEKNIEEIGAINEEAAVITETDCKNSHSKPETKVSTENKKNTIYYSIFAVVSICGIGAVCWIYNNYELTPRETLLIICCMAVMGLCLVFSALQVILAGRKGKKKENEEQRLLRDIEDEFREEKPVDLQNVIDKNMNTYVYEKYTLENKSVASTETVFMDSGIREIEYKLYAMDNKNKRHIELTKFPFTIGKMAGCVDCVLTDASVSRVHARIEKQDGKVFLTDMNSMNGTYKNGLRMEPSETLEIEPGDEIRFGKLNYCYR
ncbi:MAG: FHA domain-containing protein [Clostridiales bacterium]|nr:FHA domain-containing protein [Clostridiales bacterium]